MARDIFRGESESSVCGMVWGRAGSGQGSRVKQVLQRRDSAQLGQVRARGPSKINHALGKRRSFLGLSSHLTGELRKSRERGQHLENRLHRIFCRCDYHSMDFRDGDNPRGVGTWGLGSERSHFRSRFLE